MVTKSTTFACPLDLRAWLDAAAYARAESLATVIVDALQAHRRQVDADEALVQPSQALREVLDDHERRIKQLEAVPLVTDAPAEPSATMRAHLDDLMRATLAGGQGGWAQVAPPDDPAPDAEGWLTTREAFVLSGLPETDYRTWQANLSKGRCREWERHPDETRRMRRLPWLRRGQDNGGYPEKEEP